MKKALFVTYGGGHITMVLPVIEALKLRAPSLQCFLLALTTGYVKAVAAGGSVLGYKDLIHLADPEQVKIWGNRLQPGNGSPDVSEAESIAYLGINYLDLIEQYGADGAAAIYSKQGRYGFQPVNFMRKLFDEIRPDIVVATNSPRSEQAALEAAVKLDIPSIGMVDLFGQDSDTFVKRTIKPNITCVLSESVRLHLFEQGFHTSQVTVTGNPAFDGLFKPDTVAQAHAFIAAHHWEGLRPILWTGHMEPTNDLLPVQQTGHEFALEVETTLRKFVYDQPDLALIVRYHPSSWHTFPRLPNQERVHFSVPSIENIHPIILASAAVVVQNSTVGLESAVAGKVVVSLEHARSVQESLSLAKMGVSTPCFSTQELPAILSEVMSKHFNVAKPYASDGCAAVRVAKVIADAIGI